jgi:type VI protein secretion system component Hcp
MNFSCLIAICLAAPACRGETQIFLRLQGITGSAADTNHPSWMEVQSADVSHVNASARGAPAFADLCFSRTIDSASPPLALKCAQGSVLANGTVDFMEANSAQARYLRLHLTNIYVTFLRQNASDTAPHEFLCLAPQIFAWNYTHYKPDNGLPAAYAFSLWDSAAFIGKMGTNAPAFVMSGIRKTNGVQLTWAVTAGHTYRIFGVSALQQPFQPVAQVTASFTGNTNYYFTPSSPAMFYTVEELPSGY